MKNKDWRRGGGGPNGEGGLINFPPLKKGGLFERGALIEDLRYCYFYKDTRREPMRRREQNRRFAEIIDIIQH